MRCSKIIWLIAGIAAVSISAKIAKSDHEIRSYDKSHWGFTAVLPESWSIYRQVDVPEEFCVSFGLPKVWSEKEKAQIENAVSIMVYRKELLDEVDDVIHLEQARIADMLVSQESIHVENGMAFDSRTRRNGLEYVSRTICRFENNLGYVLVFTATDGTFAQNLPAFESFLTNLSFAQQTDVPRHLRERNHYELAREYYKFGPSHANTVIAELKRHLAHEQDDETAFILLGITQKGIRQFDEALKSFIEAERILHAKESINPDVLMLRAECHFHKKEFDKAHGILKPMWAFFQDDEKKKTQYDRMMSSINKQLNKQDTSK